MVMDRLSALAKCAWEGRGAAGEGRPVLRFGLWGREQGGCEVRVSVWVFVSVLAPGPAPGPGHSQVPGAPDVCVPALLACVVRRRSWRGCAGRWLTWRCSCSTRTWRCVRMAVGQPQTVPGKGSRLQGMAEFEAQFEDGIRRRTVDEGGEGERGRAYVSVRRCATQRTACCHTRHVPSLPWPRQR